jgi:hypothetical protein
MEWPPSFSDIVLLLVILGVALIVQLPDGD